jgi:hypothetical protein
MIRGGSVGKEERPLALRGSPLRKSCGCQRTRFIAPSINGNDNMSRSTALIRANFLDGQRPSCLTLITVWMARG